MRFFYVSLILLGNILSIIKADQIESVGRSVKDSPSFKEQALTDALREAVRLGAGVNLISKTGTKNFTLDFDRIFSASFGYIRSYKIIDSFYEDDTYTVKIVADVQPGSQEINDELALRQLISLKKSPLIAIDVGQNMTFVPKGQNYAQSWFIERAKKLQLKVVDINDIDINEPSADIAPPNQRGDKVKPDFIIRGLLDGRYQVFQGNDGFPYSIVGSFEVVSPHNQEIVAVLSLPPSDTMKSMLDSPRAAAKEVVFKYLDGGQGDNSSGANSLFRRIFSRWSADLDLGHEVLFEIESIDDKSYYHLIEHLEGLAKISLVKSKEFNPNGKTQLIVETRYLQTELAHLLMRQLGKTHEIASATEHKISFKPLVLSFWDRVLRFLRLS
jgi:hypothetical protein